MDEMQPKWVESGRWFIPCAKLTPAETERMKRDIERINAGPRKPWVTKRDVILYLVGGGIGVLVAWLLF